MTNSKEKDHWSFFKIAQALPYLFTTEFKHILELYITLSCKKQLKLSPELSITSLLLVL